MQLFKNMEQPESGDVRTLPGYENLSDGNRSLVNEAYQVLYAKNQRLGMKIAQGIAFEAARLVCANALNEDTDALAKKYGYKKTGGGNFENNGGDALAVHDGGKWKHLSSGNQEVGHDHASLERHLKTIHHMNEEESKDIQKSNKLEKCAECGKVHDPSIACSDDTGRELDEKDVKEDEGGDTYGAGDDGGVAESAGHKGEKWDDKMHKWVKATLANDENSSDDELHQHFTSQGVPHAKSKEMIARRGEFLKNIHAEAVDPMISAAAGYITHRAECAGKGRVITEEKK